MAPIGQIHPLRQKPSHASDAIVSRNNPFRERFTRAKYVASDKPANSAPTSRYSRNSALGTGFCVLGISYVLKLGKGTNSPAGDALAAPIAKNNSRTVQSSLIRFASSFLNDSAPHLLLPLISFSLDRHLRHPGRFFSASLANWRGREQTPAKGMPRQSSIHCSSGNDRAVPANTANRSSIRILPRTCRRQCTAIRQWYIRRIAVRLSLR